MISLFASNVLEVLATLYLAGDDSIHQSEIAARSGLRLIQIQRALHRLSETGLVLEQPKGNMVYYKLDPNHPIYSNMKEMLYKTILIAEPLKKALEPVLKDINLAFIYGSIASGTESSESDIDLFIVGKLGLKKLSHILLPIARQLQREINPAVYVKDEFIKKAEAKDHFITTVLGSKRLWIVGEENELRKMVK
jgi:predicted nucleotidyltransferase